MAIKDGFSCFLFPTGLAAFGVLQAVALAIRAILAQQMIVSIVRCDPFSRTWRHTQQRRLQRGASGKVIQELAEHREAAEHSDEEAPVRIAHRYLQNRREELDYARALEQGLPIGSGMMESGHKHILQARLKLAGCAWLKPNAADMAQLRVLRPNGQWTQFWKTPATLN
jgi:hypothetical protein